MPSRRTWWLLFGAGAAMLVAALVWITALVLRLEAEAQHESSMRLAMWRMDFWLNPRIGGEKIRPYFEYLPFYAQQRAYTRLLNAIEPGEVLTPSPLLTFENDLFPLHFQVNADGSIASPQVPEGNWRDLAEGSYLPEGAIAARQPRLERVRQLLAPVSLEHCVLQAEGFVASLLRESGASWAAVDQALVQLDVREQPSRQTQAPPSQAIQQWASGSQQRAEVQGKISMADMAKRAQSGYESNRQQEYQSALPPELQQQQRSQLMLQPQKGAELVPVESVDVGELVPVWLAQAMDDSRLTIDDSTADGRGGAEAPSLQSSIVNRQSPEPALLFLRRVQIGEATIYQGVLCDWPALRASLLEQISDLFPRAALTPALNPAPSALESGRMLGIVPVTLDAPCPSIAAGPAITPARTTLGLAWLAVLGAIAAAAMTLHSSIAFGEKRSRFASAVTHELRTPLTTFRMYSEMLAEDMVTDPQQRRTYLQTLRTESCRLATLVENVLSYARLEEGRATRHAHEMSVGGEGGLLARVRDVLQRRADDAGMDLVVRDHVSSEASVRADADAVGQILFNLVDNACKYASAAAPRRIEIDARHDDGRLAITVRDFGPGISAEHQRAIFRAFDRGAHGPGDTIPGVGLGLALARGLARDMGGDLTLRNAADAIPHNGETSGACFELTLNIDAAAPKRSGT